MADEDRRGTGILSPAKTVRRAEARHRQQGQVSAYFSLIILFFVAVGMLVGAFRAVMPLIQGNSSRAIITEIDQLTSTIIQEGKSSPNGYANITLARIANRGNLPAKYLIGTRPTATGIQDIEHGTVAFYPGVVDGAVIDNAFQLDFSGLTQNECATIGEHDFGTMVPAITAGPDGSFSSFENDLVTSAPTGGVYTQAQINSVCVAGHSNEVLIEVVP